MGEWSVFSWSVYVSSVMLLCGLPFSSNGKEPTCDAGDQGLIPGLGSSSGEGNGNLLQNPGEFHGQRSLAGYSSWGRKD